MEPLNQPSHTHTKKERKYVILGIHVKISGRQKAVTKFPVALEQVTVLDGDDTHKHCCPKKLARSIRRGSTSIDVCWHKYL